MPDYGHPIRFGCFLTPTNHPAPRAVELAELAEQLGFDLVTFQDHPYQPAFHDTWTLLSYVAARTERVRLAGNVLNLPLRQPAVLARAVASLDLLTGGRIALGLGAGSFWDAIAAMGGPRRTGREAVTALTEAIGVIRGLWDVTGRQGLRVDGDYYPVAGAKRGPAPAHAVPVWLGAYGPRMLRVTGRLADGWLPSLGYLKAGDLQRGNSAIDAAARRAGRDPAEITRLLNITPGETADQLTDWALNDGMSVFILGTDDKAVLRHAARELFPEVRERVAQGRRTAGTTLREHVRSAAVRAKRMPGIRYDDVPGRLDAVEPGDVAYPRYLSGYLRGGAPGLVLRPRSADAVAEAVGFARGHRQLPLGIFSAGHGISGRSLNRGGLVIDVGALNQVEVLDADAGRVRVGPGARWVDVARALAPHGLAITSGDYGGVGVGGLATAGGIGYFARQHGLTIDLVRAVEVVLADGRTVRADAETEPDLYWAMRGAGANFGVATAFEFEAPPVRDVAFAQFVFDATDTSAFLARWGEAIESADRSVTGEVMLGRRQAAQRYAQAMLIVNSDDRDLVIARLEPIARIAPLIDQQVVVAGYHEILAAFSSDAPQQGRGEPTSHSGLVRHLDAAFAAEVSALLDAGVTPFLQIRAVGGAVADVPAADTAYGWRAANFSIAALGSRRSGLDERWQELVPYFQGLYLNFETDTGDEVLERAFPPEHLARLRSLKRRYDSTGLFRDNFFIPPAPDPTP